MNFGIIIGTASNSVRRIIISDDLEYDFTQHTGLGESCLIADVKLGTDLLSVRNVVEDITGKKSPEITVAIINKDNVVVSVLAADPALDVIEGKTLVKAYSGVAVGQTYNLQTDSYIRPIAVIPANTLRKDGSRTQIDIIEGGTVVEKPK